LRQLELRAQALEAELRRTGALLAEYLRAVEATELSWVKAVIEDLRAGRLTWSEVWLRQVAAQFSPDSA
jgi:hypothetical protein